jgi:hypothetical protein
MVAEKYLRGVRTGACTPLAHIVLMKRGCKHSVTPAALPIRQHDNTKYQGTAPGSSGSVSS